jgi:hypothetical protein
MTENTMCDLTSEQASIGSIMNKIIQFHQLLRKKSRYFSSTLPAWGKGAREGNESKCTTFKA